MTDLKALSQDTVVSTEELATEFSPRKSFYGKAQVLHLQNGAKLLKSYNTIVAIVYTDDNGETNFAINGKYSATTTSHQREFIRQFAGVDVEPRKLEKYVKEF